MKLLLLVVLFALGIARSTAQSNPGSTNATDVEMEMPWPEGTIYVSASDQTENVIGPDSRGVWDGGIGGADASTYKLNWQETAGGTEAYTFTFTNSASDSSANFVCAPDRWPEGPNVYIAGTTNLADVALADVYDTEFPDQGFYLGGYTYAATSAMGVGNYTDTYQQNEKVTLITGGAPGATGEELYGFYAPAASVIRNTDATYWTGEAISTVIPPQQVQLGSLGHMDSSSSLFALLPAHTTQDITPIATGAPFYLAWPRPQHYQLVSQCVATTPANQSRTNLGVGEQVNLYFSPRLPTNAIWTTTAGGLSSTYGTNTFFTAPSNAPSGSMMVTVTAKVAGNPVSISFNVVEPSGHGYAIITGTNYIENNIIGADMMDTVWMYPTNVSFYRVYLIELPCGPTNVTGYCTNLDNGSPQEQNALVSQDNTFTDHVRYVVNNPPLPLVPGECDYIVPTEWQIRGSSLTNSLGNYVQVNKMLDSSGDFSISKWGVTMTRSINNVITTSP